MTQLDLKRQLLVERMAAHVLAHGLHNASLRPLAAAAGTSDRMLIYHFGNKDRLVAEVLQFIAQSLAQNLTARLADHHDRRTGPFLRRVWAVAQSDDLRPMLRIWLELAAVAAREGGAKGVLANTIADGFLSWTSAHLAEPADATLVLTLFEGMLVMGEVGHADTVAAALDRLDDCAVWAHQTD